MFVFKEKVGLERKRTRISLCREISMGVSKGVRLREKVLGEIPVPPLSLTGYTNMFIQTDIPLTAHLGHLNITPTYHT